MEVAQDDDDSGGSEVRVWACKDAEEPVIKQTEMNCRLIRLETQRRCGRGVRVRARWGYVLCAWVTRSSRPMCTKYDSEK